ncbi:hypothetical protein AAZX31_13G041800 [Glycine max]
MKCKVVVISILHLSARASSFLYTVRMWKEMSSCNQNLAFMISEYDSRSCADNDHKNK